MCCSLPRHGSPTNHNLCTPLGGLQICRGRVL